ncbi:response regulator [Cellvibrio sp. QJXJ]|uniref:response regulator n=1 Tax=Cellvibrio sp. QJXJ TaxID=2964606 RepID=UPI0021C3FAAC|nr:response regulator [Cellvibrio sp. QJXJ]UUA73316.1 response regulator [Cellvibrio sp. QJXJ]
MQNIRLLIIDDDEDDFILVKDLLTDISQSCILDWAPTYEMGQRLLQEDKHDLCLMDYKLGARDGIELLKFAHEVGFSGPVILLTGMHQVEVDRQALQAGAVDYLVKSTLSAEQLARAIRYALARRDVERERVERLKAESENRSKSEFLAHLSHELRTPLSAILGFTELLLNKTTDSENAGHLRIVHRNGKHLLGLLNDILDLSKIEAGKLELEKQPVSFAAFLTDIYFLMQGAAADKNLQLRIEAPQPLPLTINTDPMRLRQILLNLMGNAIKFTHQGEVVLTIDWVDQTRKDKIRFSVKDSGIGICEETLKVIFEPFVQSKNAQVHPRAGTGLGLTISKQLVERLGGNIQVSSVVGEGSEFSFTLAIDESDCTETAILSLNIAAATEHNVEIPRFTGRVLVADDLRDIRTLIGHFVQLTGAEVVYATDGANAVRIINADKLLGKHFDLVLMDIHMPVMDGHQAAQQLRSEGFTLPLVALTAAHMKGDMDHCFESGFTAYLGKPLDQARLYNCLARFLTPSTSALTTSSPAKSILVVEDDADTLAAMTGLLTLLGWQVFCAQCAAAALEELDKHKLHTALIDLNLPDMSGYLCAAKIRERNPEVRLIVASGETLDPRRAADAGIAASLLKPVSLAQLEAILD